jgi:uncharacterized protein (DUF302 family)
MNAMSYYLSKTLETPFEAAVEKVTEALKNEGFGVLTEIDIQATMKKKLDVNIRKYKILGACNPPLAYQAIQAEDKIGLMLPCNVIVQEVGSGGTEVAAIDPVASMQAVNNPKLGEVGERVRDKLKRVIDGL